MKPANNGSVAITANLFIIMASCNMDVTKSHTISKIKHAVPCTLYPELCTLYAVP
jgi:hypothetical protein